MATDAYGLLDAIAEDDDVIGGYGSESPERLAECAKAVRLLTEATAGLWRVVYCSKQ